MLATTDIASTGHARVRRDGPERIARLLSAKTTAAVMESVTMASASAMLDGQDQTVPQRNARVFPARTLALATELVMRSVCSAIAQLGILRLTVPVRHAPTTVVLMASVMMASAHALLGGVAKTALPAPVSTTATDTGLAKLVCANACLATLDSTVLLPSALMIALTWASVSRMAPVPASQPAQGWTAAWNNARMTVTDTELAST